MWALRARRVQRAVLWLARKVGLPSPYYDGVPAAMELDSVDNQLDRLGVPRSVPCPDGSPWPLCTRQRLKVVASVTLTDDFYWEAPDAQTND